MTSVIDTNRDATPHLGALKDAGVRTVARYLDPLFPADEKCIKPEEARAIADASLRLALVCEGWGDFAHGGISAAAGERDGEFCARYAARVGASANACVYFAVDTDASAHEIRKLVLPYFVSIGRVFHAAEVSYRLGVYGSGAVCEAVAAAQLAQRTWLSASLGWRGSRAYLAERRFALRQHLPRHVAGLLCDPDEANGEFGDFAPYASAAV